MNPPVPPTPPVPPAEAPPAPADAGVQVLTPRGVMENRRADSIRAYDFRQSGFLAPSFLRLRRSGQPIRGSHSVRSLAGRRVARSQGLASRICRPLAASPQRHPCLRPGHPRCRMERRPGRACHFLVIPLSVGRGTRAANARVRRTGGFRQDHRAVQMVDPRGPDRRALRLCPAARQHCRQHR